MLTNRNCGYAKYASKESAEEAIKVHLNTKYLEQNLVELLLKQISLTFQKLHGAEICGIRLKVLEAEEPRNGDDRRKRMKVDFSGDN